VLLWESGRRLVKALAHFLLDFYTQVNGVIVGKVVLLIGLTQQPGGVAPLQVTSTPGPNLAMTMDPVAAKSSFLCMYMSNHKDTLACYVIYYGKVTNTKITSAEMTGIDSRVRIHRHFQASHRPVMYLIASST
jgi:hypothetical protein